MNVPSLHVLHRGSPHDETPTGVSVVCLVCILVKWIDFPRPLEKVSPHSSHTLLFLSMVVVDEFVYLFHRFGSVQHLGDLKRLILCRSGVHVALHAVLAQSLLHIDLDTFCK